MSDIEPAFGELHSAGREISCGHGTIDNLFVTPEGEIVVVETKLWRNSQMRREVVAQALDYVAALTQMGYEAFEKTVSRGQGSPAHLYDLVCEHPDALEEPRFIDAVSMNLKRGRLVAIVLGDGIRTETESLGELLQGHAGAHFTFALVELATWLNEATGDIVALPSTLAKTVMIERGVVRIEDGGAVRVAPVPASDRAGAQSLSLSDFFEHLAARDPQLPAAIRAFLAEAEPLGVYPDLKASLNLKIDLPQFEKSLNFGYIQKNGQLWTNPFSWTVPQHVWMPYNQRLADLIGGSVVTGSENYVSADGKSAPRIEQLLPAHQSGWIAAIRDAIRAASSNLEAE